MTDEQSVECESDPRFPSGRWAGFFVDGRIPGKHQMELLLTFRSGVMTGEGRDFVGKFVIRGQYAISDGKCHWHKRYLGRHDVFYQGFNEGKGIWGTWELIPKELYGHVHGGFHIWPEKMGDAEHVSLVEEASVPANSEVLVEA